MTSTDSSAALDIPFGLESTAADVIAGVDLSGKRAIVTGGASGLGAETALRLAGAGASVTLAVRDTAAGEQAREAIVAASRSDSVDVASLDLADLDSVAAFAASWNGPLDILVDNAGVMGLPDRQISTSGAEMHFAVNHLGHFALANALHDALAAAPGTARIVSVSSLVHMVSPVVFDDVNFERRDYVPILAYGQSKTANVLFAVEANRRWAADGIVANALHPGVILETNLMRHMDAEDSPPPDDGPPPAYAFKNIGQGAATSVLLAASSLVEGVGGRYFQDCQEAATVDRQPFGLDLPGEGVAAYALDPEAAARLWQVSLEMAGIGG